MFIDENKIDNPQISISQSYSDVLIVASESLNNNKIRQIQVTLLNINNNKSMEEINVEAGCKNCSHDIGLHSPKCSKRDHERICGCDRPEYYGAIVSDTKVGWTEFHCNRCGNLIGFLNSIDENIYEIIKDEILLCIKCIALKN